MSFYFLNTNECVVQSLYWQLFFHIFGALFVFNESGTEGIKMFMICPQMIFSFLWQFLVLVLRNCLYDALKKILWRETADLLDWYAEIEGKLAYEEFENINQIFSISQFKPLYNKITNSTIERTLKLINRNMIKCTKS